VASDLDRSKPYVPILETSSQLIEESFVTGGGEKRLEILVTPLKKRAGRMRKRKRSIEVVEKTETGVSDLPLLIMSMSWSVNYHPHLSSFHCRAPQQRNPNTLSGTGVSISVLQVFSNWQMRQVSLQLAYIILCVVHGWC